MEKMKAVLCTAYGPPEVLEYTEVEKPVPGDHEILVRMHATAVTASDCIVRGFKLPRRSPRGFLMGLVLGFRRPRNSILGMIVAGEVEATGKEVIRFAAGDLVYGWTLKGPGSIRFGTYAEYKCLPENSVIIKKPHQITFEQAAAIPYGALIGLHFLKQGAIENRSSVMIYGASGAIGTAAVQLAKYYGAEVTGVCSTGNIDLVRSLGADDVLDYTEDDPAASGKQFDLILDAVGRWKDSAFKRKCAGLLTGEGASISVDDGSPKAGIGDLELVDQLVRDGKFNPVIDKTFPLEKMAEAHRYVDGGHKKGNVIINIS